MGALGDAKTVGEVSFFLIVIVPGLFLHHNVPAFLFLNYTQYSIQTGTELKLSEATDGATVAVDYDRTLEDAASLKKKKKKKKIAELTGVPSEQQRLVYQGM